MLIRLWKSTLEPPAKLQQRISTVILDVAEKSELHRQGEEIMEIIDINDYLRSGGKHERHLTTSLLECTNAQHYSTCGKYGREPRGN